MERIEICVAERKQPLLSVQINSLYTRSQILHAHWFMQYLATTVLFKGREFIFINY